jgi:S-adenosylmethionine hydrolase
MLERPIITLTTDYGLKDSFVGMTKGVIIGINPHAKIIDITHNIERHNIYGASQVIGMSYKYFPPTTIHVAVVDPKVGGERRPILVITENYYFIGPDNGIFTPIFEKEQSNFFKVLHITSSHYFLHMTGATFHGRDIFAPVAAWLSKGVDSLKFGEQISDYIKIPLPESSLSDGNIIHGEVVSIDHYGNAITNIATDTLSQLAPIDSKHKFRIMYQDRRLYFVNYYSEVKDRALSATINGFGRLELFVNQDDAVRIFNIRIGDPVSVMLEN